MTSEKTNDRGFDTRSIHAGRDPDCSSMPIYMASTGKHHYTRGGNPTNDAFEASVASLEGGTGAVASACGTAAVTQTLLTLLKSGDRVVCHRSVYDWTDMFLREDGPKFGIETVQLDLRDLCRETSFGENAACPDELNRSLYSLCRATLVRLSQMDARQRDIGQDRIVNLGP